MKGSILIFFNFALIALTIIFSLFAIVSLLLKEPLNSIAASLLTIVFIKLIGEKNK